VVRLEHVVAATSVARPETPRRADHVWPVDVVRLSAFAAVIMVHSIAFTEQPDNSLAAGALMLLQFGREVFFALTAFVLVLSTQHKPTAVDRFWAKRILYVAVPYGAWSAIYYAYSVLGPQHLRPSLSGFGLDLLDGGAMYHLYFLLVTIQLYLVFPLLLAFVRRTAPRAGAVLAVVIVANLTWLAVLQWVPAPCGGLSWLWAHAYELLPTYAMYVVGGCYAAIHFARLQGFVERHQPLLLAIAGACVVAAITAYAVQLPDMAPRQAANVLQPATTFSCLAALIVTYIAGCRWTAAGRPHQQKVALLSDLSFGIFLSHPLVLQVFLDHGLGNNGQRLPALLATLLGWALAALGGAALSALARRTAVSLVFTGRPRIKRSAPLGSQLVLRKVSEEVQIGGRGCQT
jgi:peptidoglycan/LPS O-acetylase OafA/YrhL